MPIYGSTDNLESIIGCLKNSNDIDEYISTFVAKFKAQLAEKKLKIGFEKVKVNENIFAIEQVYKTLDFGLCKYEAHKNYIDLHCVALGEELHYVSNVDQLILDQTYNKENDFSLYESSIRHSERLLTQGGVVLYSTKDAHMTGVKVDKSALVVKTVMKIPINEF